MMMGMNVIEACRKAKVSKKIVLIGTVCSYPKHCAVPFWNLTYGKDIQKKLMLHMVLQKKALYVMLDAYKKAVWVKQYHNSMTNLYGPNDNFDDSQ